MAAAPATVLAELDPLGIVPLRLLGLIVAPLALLAREGDGDSNVSASHGSFGRLGRAGPAAPCGTRNDPAGPRGQDESRRSEDEARTPWSRRSSTRAKRSRRGDSNPGPPPYHGGALPAELRRRRPDRGSGSGGSRIRTCVGSAMRFTAALLWPLGHPPEGRRLDCRGGKHRRGGPQAAGARLRTRPSAAAPPGALLASSACCSRSGGSARGSPRTRARPPPGSMPSDPSARSASR